MSQSMNPQLILMKLILVGAALGLMPAFAGEGGTQQPSDPPTENVTPASSVDLPDTFGALDRDGNGVLSEEEGAQIEPERWKRMDSNGDGMIERSEFSAVELDVILEKK